MDLKLSEAIRLGSMVTTKAVGMSDGENGRCALGAAAEAVGIDCGFLTVYSDLISRFPILDRSFEAPHPWGNFSNEPLYRVIYILNDVGHWTRETIADYVERIEASEAAKVIEANREMVYA